MPPIILDNISFILLIVLIFLLLFFFFPIAFFICFVVPFLILKTVYHAFVKHMHEHSLWWDIPFVLIIILSIIMVILYFNGYRF